MMVFKMIQSGIVFFMISFTCFSQNIFNDYEFLKTVNSSSNDVSGICPLPGNANSFVSISQDGSLQVLEDTTVYYLGNISTGTNNDFESVTNIFIENGVPFFACVNEVDNFLYVFSVFHNGTQYLFNQSTVALEIVDASGAPIQSNYSIGDKIEGATFNAHTGKFYFSLEEAAPTLYESTATFFAEEDFYSKMHIEVQKVETEIDTLTGIDFAGLFHLAYNCSDSNLDEILVLSQTLKSVYRLDLNTSPAQLTDSYLLQNSGPKPEGIAMFNNNLIVAQDNDLGGDSYYIYKNANQVVEEVFDTIAQNGDYLLPDGTYTNTTGDYNYTLTSVNGCDSLVTIHLTVITDVKEEESNFYLNDYLVEKSVAYFNIKSNWAGKAKLEIYRVNGQQMANKEINLFVGYNNIEVKGNFKNKQIGFILLSNGTSNFSEKILVANN